MNVKGSIWLLGIGLAVAGNLLAAQEGTLIRAADLKAKPQIDAPTLKSLAENTPLKVIGNDGGWSQVSTADGKQGWVRLLNVRLAAVSDNGSNLSKNFGALGNVMRTGSTGTSATTAAKGLNKEDLVNASPNFGELKKLDEYKTTPAAAAAYAKSEKLIARDVPEAKP